MKMNIRLVLLIEKLGAIAVMLIPESGILLVKKLFRNKDTRSELLSNDQSYFLMRIQKGINNLDMVYRTTNFTLRDKVVVELGTGGHGIDLILFYLLGAKKIYTVDVKFFGLLSMPQAISDTEQLLDLIISQFHLERDDTNKKYDLIKNQTSVESILNIMNVEFLTFKEARVNKLDTSTKIDLFFSESNLQRIPLDQMNSLFKNLAPVFSEDAVSFHRLDCNDINTQKSRPIYDPNLWKLEYLKYSDFTWNLITTKRFGSQNRLRQSHFIDLFETIGFSPNYIENYTHEGDLERVVNFKLNKKFKKIDPENVAISHFRFVASKNNETREATSKNFVLNGAFAHAKPKWSIEMGLTEK